MKIKFMGSILLSFASLITTAQAGLISSWNLNGDYSDTTSNGHNGVGFGNSLPSFVTDNASGNGLSASFNNSNYIALNQSFAGKGSLAEFSASAWFKTSAVGKKHNGLWASNWGLLDFDRSEFFNMYVTGNGRIGFSTRAENIDDMYSITSGLNDGLWHQVTVTYGNATGKVIYIDGDIDSSTSYKGALGTNKTRYGFIGDGSEAASFNGSRNKKHYEGLISEVKLWDNALSSQEVIAKVPEPSTVAIFALGLMSLVSRQLKSSRRN